MTANEMSNEFDVIFNNITSNQAPGLDEYEKSVFLTKAQDELVRQYFSPETNKSNAGFDDSKIRQADFSTLIDQANISCAEATIDDAPIAAPVTTPVVTAMTKTSVYPGVWYCSMANAKPLIILNEGFILKAIKAGPTGDTISIVTNKMVKPISYIEFDRLMMKPFRRPVKNCVWRLINKSSDKVILIGAPSDHVEEAVGTNKSATYYYRYVKRPSPIITAQLDNGVTVDGTSTQTACSLDPIVHHEIVQRAAELAKAAYVGDLASTVQLGTASQTGLGIINDGRR